MIQVFKYRPRYVINRLGAASTPSYSNIAKREKPVQPDFSTAVLALEHTRCGFKTHEAALGPLLVVLHRMRMLASSAKDD